MSDAESPSHLSHHHRRTLELIETHPTTHNLEWNDVIALLEEVADVKEEHDGKFLVTLGGGRIVLTRPRDKDVDEQMVIDLRHLFKDTPFMQSRA